MEYIGWSIFDGVYWGSIWGGVFWLEHILKHNKRGISIGNILNALDLVEHIGWSIPSGILGGEYWLEDIRRV